eukprot:COSAG04_NODE_7852_length_1056_cov_1.724138_1_plen_81_part_10
MIAYTRDDEERYRVWVNSSKPGENKSTRLSKEMSAQEALKAFQAKFREKTGYTWAGHAAEYDHKANKYKVQRESVSADSGE